MATKAEKEAAKAAEKAEKEAAKAADPVASTSDDSDSSDSDSVTVTWPRGSRVYSKEVHSKDFKKLAKQFAEKSDIQGTVA